MRTFGRCEEISNNSQIVLKEKHSKITFENASHKSIRIIKIDGCVIKEGLRCDYLVIPDTQIENYVELKGSDVSHAVKQLEQTISKVSEDRTKCEKYCFIISTRCPLLTTKIQNIKHIFKKQYNAKLVIKNLHCQHEF